MTVLRIDFTRTATYDIYPEDFAKLSGLDPWVVEMLVTAPQEERDELLNEILSQDMDLGEVLWAEAMADKPDAERKAVMIDNEWDWEVEVLP